mmetsp:Transcript_45634/g.75863  ORF Transcript_45634/g.75863 Transcript_45634/m.75863 type:complete len:293 (-) Transcript_45634:501-1379(-)
MLSPKPASAAPLLNSFQLSRPSPSWSMRWNILCKRSIFLSIDALPGIFSIICSCFLKFFSFCLYSPSFFWKFSRICSNCVSSSCKSFVLRLFFFSACLRSPISCNCSFTSSNCCCLSRNASSNSAIRSSRSFTTFFCALISSFLFFNSTSCFFSMSAFRFCNIFSLSSSALYASIISIYCVANSSIISFWSSLSKMRCPLSASCAAIFFANACNILVSRADKPANLICSWRNAFAFWRCCRASSFCRANNRSISSSGPNILLSFSTLSFAAFNCVCSESRSLRSSLRSLRMS